MLQTTTQYDYIFAGFGMSACHVLLEMAANGLLDDRRVLILESRLHRVDKSWSFWNHENSRFASVVSKSWKKGVFVTDDAAIECVAPYFTYQYTTSDDFIGHTKKQLQAFPLIEFIDARMLSWNDAGRDVVVESDKGQYTGRHLFNSYPSPALHSGKHPLLLQHFRGWFVKTDTDAFDPDTITLMDFTVEQKQNTRFIYLLPFTKNTALVEYTLFSPDLLDQAAYDLELQRFLENHGLKNATITRTEAGVIPMTTYPFWNKNTRNVLHIGTAGGWTKPSTGYTWARAEKLSQKLSVFLKQDSIDFTKFRRRSRFDFYDSIFIHVLYSENHLGKAIFTALFKNAGGKTVLSFLKEQTNIWQELRIIMACPKIPFIRALFKTLKPW